MAEPQFNEEGIEIPSEVLNFGEYSIIRYTDGREYKLYGYGSMKDQQLDLDPRIDLTKPIYEQAMKLWKEDGANERKQGSNQAA
ncbi:MAG TPA: hypothetical protein VFC39_13415 [Acidobacteriaceae bacterium]|nr:hypothetical protein [Acidobacteriaceae bacterium]